MPSISLTRFRLAAFASVLLVSLAYANHWQNTFQFDDSHSIVENANIRELGNIPRLFTDASTASALSTNAAYRPITSLTLAIDYAIGGGLTPWAFHLSTFIGFLLLLGAIGVLCRTTLEATRPGPWSAWAGLFGATLFGVHPVAAQTVNYIIQRAEVWSALGVVTGMALFAARPALRRYGLYLVPPALGVLAKTIASIFPAFVLLYVVIVERPRTRTRWLHVAASAAAIVGVTTLCARMTLAAGRFDPGGPPFAQYLWTQPWIFVRYLTSFVLPLDLSLDPGAAPLASPTEPRALVGLAVVALFVAAIAQLARRRAHAATAFGLGWFLAALIPVSVFPLAEVTNDHRMFLPFVGLAIAASGIARALLERLPARRPVLAGAAVLVLIVAAAGTWQRNTVWRSQESAWAEVVAKNPTNGRGRMNYGVALMARGAMPDALAQFEHALPLTPNYGVLEVNLAIAKSALGRTQEAERHFQRAMVLMPSTQVAALHYGRWLRQQGRLAEAVAQLERAVAISPADLPAQEELMLALSAHRAYGKLKTVASSLLRAAPGNATAARAVQEAEQGLAALADLRAAVVREPSAEGWLDLSLRLYHVAEYRASLEAASEALRYRPDYAEAFNNIAVAHSALQEWPQAVAAADRALQLKPDFALARNNRAWAASHIGR